MTRFRSCVGVVSGAVWVWFQGLCGRGLSFQGPCGCGFRSCVGVYLSVQERCGCGLSDRSHFSFCCVLSSFTLDLNWKGLTTLSLEDLKWKCW